MLKTDSPDVQARDRFPTQRVTSWRRCAMPPAEGAKPPGSGVDLLIPLLPGIVVTAPALVGALTLGDERLLVPAVGGLMHLLAALSFPSVARLRRPLLRPANLPFAAFSLQLLVLPWLTVLVPYERPGFAAPSLALESQSLFLIGLAFSCMLAGQKLLPGTPRHSAQTGVHQFASRADGSTFIAWIFIAVGLVGLWMYFQDPASLVNYYSGSYAVQKAVQSHTVVQGVSTFIRPFLNVGLVLLWVRGRSAVRLQLRDAVFFLLLVLAASSYSYNRGQAVATIVATAAVLLVLSGHRTSRLTAALGLLLVVGASFQMGQLREQNNFASYGLTVNRSSGGERLLQDLQLYGNGPQFAGFMLEIRAGEPLLLGDSIYRSLISPLPILGEAGRSESGSGLYNRAIYGSLNVRDQIPLATIESYWNGGVPAVMIFGLLLGTASGWLDRVFLRSDRMVPRFAAAFYGYWAGMAVISSYEVIAQIVIYSAAPYVVLIVLEKMRARTPAQAGLSEPPPERPPRLVSHVP